MNPSLKDFKRLGVQARNFVWSIKDRIHMDSDFGCGCAVTSYVLQRLVYREFADCKIDFAIGEYDKQNHCWLIYRKKVIDPTATQFGLFPKVRIVNEDDEDYFRYNVNYLNRRAMNELTLWEEQSPFAYKKEINYWLNKTQRREAA